MLTPGSPLSAELLDVLLADSAHGVDDVCRYPTSDRLESILAEARVTGVTASLRHLAAKERDVINRRIASPGR